MADGSPADRGAVSAGPPREPFPANKLCGCKKWCGDLAEDKDKPGAVCKLLPMKGGRDA